jgi:hypothetical protein
MYEKMMQAAPKTSKGKKSKLVRIKRRMTKRQAVWVLLAELADVDQSGTVLAFRALRVSPKVR